MSDAENPPTFEELKARIADWSEAIPGGPPGGTNAKFDPAYEALAKEIGKLDSPSGGAVNWPEAMDQAGNLLKKISKDLLVAAWMANGLYVTKNLDGLATGTTLIADMLDRYWDTLFPEPNRLRARANALGWFLDRVNMTLPSLAVTAQDRKPLGALGVAAKKLSDVAREKFAGSGPALGPFLENVERLKLSLPAEAPPPPPPPPPPPKPAEPPPTATAAPTPPTQAAPPATSAAPVPALEAAPAFDPSGDVMTYLRNLGANLMTVSGHLRRSNAADPAAYRLLRTGLWLHMTQPPGGVTSGKTPAPPLAPVVRTRLEQMAGNGRFAELLEEAESALAQARFCLDLNRFSALALAQLGPSHAAARTAILAEVATLVRRMPNLTQLTFSDGTPFADPQTKSWIEGEVLPTKGGGDGAGGASDDPTTKILDEARELSSGGKAPEAIAHLQAALKQVPSAEARFKVRLTLAETAFGAGHSTLARALFDALAKEIDARGLDEWQPTLAARCLEGYLQCLRTLARAGKGVVEPAVLTVIYDRLGRLDPSAALRLGAGS